MSPPHRPRTFAYNPLRQVLVSITQAPAAITPGAPNKDLKPSGMRIAFSGAPVAPLEKIGKDAGDAVTLEPTVPGKWTWLDGSTLSFQPDGHWQPGTQLTARVKPTPLAKDLHLDRETHIARRAGLDSRRWCACKTGRCEDPHPG